MSIFDERFIVGFRVGNIDKTGEFFYNIETCGTIFWNFLSMVRCGIFFTDSYFMKERHEKHQQTLVFFCDFFTLKKWNKYSDLNVKSAVNRLIGVLLSVKY